MDSLMVHGDLDSAVMKLEEDFEELKVTLAAQKSDLAALKSENDELKLQNEEDFEKVKATVDELKSENDELKCQNAEFAREISFLKNPPFYHLCVYQESTTATSS